MSVLSISELSEAFRAELKKPKNPKPVCKGLIFRYSRDTWMGTAKDINFRDRFRFIKGKSCTGCEQCDFLWEDLHENLCDPKFNYIAFDADAHDQDQLFIVVLIPGSPDWETGYVEDWELEFRKYEEPEPEKELTFPDHAINPFTPEANKAREGFCHMNEDDSK